MLKKMLHVLLYTMIGGIIAFVVTTRSEAATPQEKKATCDIAVDFARNQRALDFIRFQDLEVQAMQKYKEISKGTIVYWAIHDNLGLISWIDTPWSIAESAVRKSCMESPIWREL